MSGCMHPISFGPHYTIHVNSLVFESVIGSGKARIIVDNSELYSKGDQVEIIEVSVNDNTPSGRSVTRFVKFTEERMALHLDDDSIVLHLVPTRFLL